MQEQIMQKPKVSVTVPVYNTSGFLRKCLDSLACQTLKEIEIIVVDDGSTDNSGNICDEYASKYPNFKVIHQENGGLSAARQTGLEHASGEYIIVCDSDDWAEPDMYELLYKEGQRTDADLILCGFFAEYPDGRSIPVQKIYNHLDWEGHLKEQFCTNSHSSWIRMMRRSMLVDNGINYEPGINMGEDMLILYKLLLNKPKIAQIEKKLYHYRKELSGSSYSANLKFSSVMQMNKTFEWIKSHYDPEMFHEGFFNLDIDLMFAALRAKKKDKYFIKNFMNRHMTWGRLLNHRKSPKAVAVYAAKIFPIQTISKLIDKLYKYVY